MDRREALGGIAAAMANWIPGVTGSVKTTVANGQPVFLLTFAEDVSVLPEDMKRIQDEWDSRFGQLGTLIILSPGIEVELVGVCKLRQRIDEYEFEATGRTPEEAKSLWEYLTSPSK